MGAGGNENEMEINGREKKELETLRAYFEQICGIPRQSGDEARIGRFLTEFAWERGLLTETDAAGNLLIRKKSPDPAYRGPVVTVQGHMDMVYEKTAASRHVYEDGIRVRETDGYLESADQTSLGADNGVALAYMMDLMDQEDPGLPDLEFLITVGEEEGLRGVKDLGLSGFRGDFLINLDAEEEGVFFTSCAGGARARLVLPIRYEKQSGEIRVLLKVEGLRGGHSGLEIGLGRANAAQVLGRVLCRTEEIARVGRISFPGKANAIAARGEAEFYLPEDVLSLFRSRIADLEEELRREYEETDAVSLTLQAAKGDFAGCFVYSREVVRALGGLLALLPCGALRWADRAAGMVESSANIGAVTEEEGALVVLCSARSSLGSRKEAIKEQMRLAARFAGAQCEFFGEYPQWEYRSESRLREICAKTYRERSGKEAVFTGIHAGLECGYLAQKMGGQADMISFGATLREVHTPREQMDLASFYRTRGFLRAVLLRLAKEPGLR